MADKRYRAGIVGLRGIAAGPLPKEASYPLKRLMFTSHAASLALVPQTEVVAYCDLDESLLDQFKSNWGSTWPDARPYTDFDKMIAEADLDILAVCTGDATHRRFVVGAAEAGIKGIICEKPLATSMEDVNSMLKACEDNGANLAVGHTRRWRQVYHKVRETIESGAIGPVTTIVSLHTGARAMLFRNGTHLIDGICFFADSPPKQVWSKLEDGFDDWDVYKGQGGKDPATEPAASGFILHENGVRSFYIGTKESVAPRSTIQLTGPKGQISLTMDSGTATMVTPGKESSAAVEELVPDDYQALYYVAAYEELIDLIENGGESVSAGKYGRWVVQIMTGFLKSHTAGSTLVDVPE